MFECVKIQICRHQQLFSLHPALISSNKAFNFKKYAYNYQHNLEFCIL